MATVEYDLKWGIIKFLESEHYIRIVNEKHYNVKLSSNIQLLMFLCINSTYWFDIIDVCVSGSFIIGLIVQHTAMFWGIIRVMSPMWKTATIEIGVFWRLMRDFVPKHRALQIYARYGIPYIIYRNPNGILSHRPFPSAYMINVKHILGNKYLVNILSCENLLLYVKINSKCEKLGSLNV